MVAGRSWARVPAYPWSGTLAHSFPQVSPGIIANPFAAGIGRRNSLESISSIDRELSPEGPGKVSTACGRQPQGQGACGWQSPNCLLCPQEKELPGQTLHGGPEAMVSVWVIPILLARLLSAWAWGSELWLPLPAGALQGGHIPDPTTHSTPLAAPTACLVTDISWHCVYSTPQGRSPESLKLDYRTLAATPGPGSVQRVSVPESHPGLASVHLSHPCISSLPSPETPTGQSSWAGPTVEGPHLG